MGSKMSNQIINRLLAILLITAITIMLLTGHIPVAHAAEASGDCGNGLSWSLNGGTLTISGKGDMPDYQEFTPAPWNAYSDSIRSVRVESGVTSVGDFAFFCLSEATAVTLANSVTEIGSYAFYGCSALELLNLGGGVRTIGESAFEECTSLMSVQLPSSLKTLRFHAFYRCESLVSITVPSSVTTMESTVFAYCTNLRSASVLASIQELPLWTFYGCYELSSVTLSSSIGSVGTYAFYNCDKLPQSGYTISDSAGRMDSSTTTTKQENGATITTDSHYTEQANSAINVQTAQTQSGTTTTVETKVDAILDNADGWSELEERVDRALLANDDTVQVNVSLKGDAEVSGEDLDRFAGKNVALTIHTQQGAYWHINGTDISSANLADSYDLSFTLQSLTDPTEEQAAAVGTGTSFVVVFDKTIDFKVEVELPLGASLARNTAVFFAPGEEGGFERMQATVIDAEGIAHFYLGLIQAKTEYLIGINIPDRDAESGISDAIVPEALQNEYPQLEQVAEVEYVVTGVKSSWNMNFGQVSLILAAVMIGSVIVVGVVMAILFKRKLKNGYVPDMSYADDK